MSQLPQITFLESWHKISHTWDNIHFSRHDYAWRRQSDGYLTITPEPESANLACYFFADGKTVWATTANMLGGTSDEFAAFSRSAALAVLYYRITTLGEET